MQSGKTIRQLVVDGGLMTQARFNELTSPEAVCRLGQHGMPMIGPEAGGV